MKPRPKHTNAGTPRAQTAIDAERKQYAGLFELAPIAYLSLGAGQIIRHANLAAADLLRADRERLLGAEFGSFVAEHSRPALAGFLAQLCASASAQSCELDLSREKQSSLAVLLTARPGSGESECLVAITDISQRRLAAEAALAESKERFRSLARISSDFYWRTDAEHRITHSEPINKRSGRRSLRHGMSVGARRWEVPSLSPDEAGWEAHRAVLDAHLPFLDFELSRLGIDGSERYMSISGDPVFDASGAFTGYHGLGRDITRHKEVEKALREREARFRNLTEMSSDFYWETDAEHRFTKQSLAYAGRNGIQAFQGQLRFGLRPWEIPCLSPDKEIWEAHRKLHEAHLPFRNFEVCRLGTDGAARYMLVCGDPVFDASGAFTGYHGMGRDITERKLAEKTLRESEERYRSLFANAGDGIMILSRSGKIVVVNESFARMHGYSVQEVMSLSLEDLLTPEAFQLAPERWERILSGEVMAIEVRHRHKDGHLFPVEISASLTSSGEQSHMQFLYRNVTERKRAETAVAESEERYRSLFANAGDGILILSRDGQMVAANEAFARMHGYSVQEVMSLSLEDLLTPEAFKGLADRVKRILAGEKMTLELKHNHRNGHVFPVEVSTSAISWGGETYIQSFVRDITERKRNEAALLAANREAESANRAKTRFLAAASHDLRQPIQAINLFLDALIQTSLSVEQKEITGYLGMSVSGLRKMLGTLLDISQLDAGVVKPNTAVIHAENLLRELEHEFAHFAKKRNLRLRFCARRGLPLTTDVSLLLRALRNVIDNAIKYTERGGILICVRRRGARALIQVWDTGIGIAPEHIGHIFEEYFQIGNQARDRTRGLGLGLSIVERKVKLIGGEISCRSRPGRGSVFEINLPLFQSPSNGSESPFGETAADPGAAESSRFIGRRIVVIEDDYLVAKGIEQALEARGVTVTSFRNAEEALASSASAEADFYISDFRLPGQLNGIELLDAIQRRSGDPINAVLMTGDTSSNQIELSAASNWKVLFKPVDLQALLAAI